MMDAKDHLTWTWGEHTIEGEGMHWNSPEKMSKVLNVNIPTFCPGLKIWNSYREMYWSPDFICFTYSYSLYAPGEE